MLFSPGKKRLADWDVGGRSLTVSLAGPREWRARTFLHERHASDARGEERDARAGRGEERDERYAKEVRRGMT
eukprot:102374-Rhodomonas_salina.2